MADSNEPPAAKLICFSENIRVSEDDEAAQQVLTSLNPVQTMKAGQEYSFH